MLGTISLLKHKIIPHVFCKSSVSNKLQMNFFSKKGVNFGKDILDDLISKDNWIANTYLLITQNELILMQKP